MRTRKHPNKPAIRPKKSTRYYDYKMRLVLILRVHFESVDIMPTQRERDGPRDRLATGGLMIHSTFEAASTRWRSAMEGVGRYFVQQLATCGKRRIRILQTAYYTVGSGAHRTSSAELANIPQGSAGGLSRTRDACCLFG